jgi:hypothetical protein
VKIKEGSATLEYRVGDLWPATPAEPTYQLWCPTCGRSSLVTEAQWKLRQQAERRQCCGRRMCCLLSQRHSH